MRLAGSNRSFCVEQLGSRAVPTRVPPNYLISWLKKMDNLLTALFL